MIATTRPAHIKSSGIDWVGDIPAHWSIVPFFAFADEVEAPNAGMKETNLLSLSYGRIVRKDINRLEGLTPESFEGYNIVEANDIVFRLTDLQNDKNSLRSAIASERGIITSAYVTARPRSTPRFFNYLMRAYDASKVFYGIGGGIRQSMKYDDLKRLPVVLPDYDERERIANFLDRETTRIDALVAKKTRFIELLAEKRQALITRAVTKGLNPSVPMKDSGIDWLGEVPAHWQIKQLRHFASVLRGKFSHRPRNDPAFYDGAFPFIQTGDITGSKKFVEQYTQTLNDRGAAVSKEFPAGTLVMAIAANIGDVAILTFAAYFPDSIVGMVPKEGIDLDYMYSLLLAMKPVMLRTATINTQMNLNADQIVSLVAACPPIAEQRAIAKHLNEETRRIDVLVIKTERSIALLREHRIALITAAVTGKIDLRDAA